MRDTAEALAKARAERAENERILAQANGPIRLGR
jgi:hypothetical protein